MANGYQWFEVQKHRFAMTSKMLFQISIFCLILQPVLFWLAMKIPRFGIYDGSIQTAERVPGIYRELLWKYPAASFVQQFGLNPTFHIQAPPDRLKKWPRDARGFAVCKARDLTRLVNYDLVLRAYRFPFVLSFLSWMLLWPLALFYVQRATARIKDTEHIRGARLITEADIRSKCGQPGILPIASIRISESLSRRHLLIAGQTGSGKSTVLIQHVDAIQKAQRRAIINDYKGEMVGAFYRPEQDLILNPLDERGLGWTLFNELKSVTDFAALTGSLIPLGKGDERFWCAAAQDVLRGVLAYCYDHEMRTNAALWKALTSPIASIRDMCHATTSGQAGYTYVQDASSKQAVGVHAVLMSFVSWLEFVIDGPFCLRDWATSGRDSIIFVTNLEETSNIMRPYLSLFADFAGKRFLSLPDSTDTERTVYLILDELGNMQRLPSVKKLLTAGRSKGVVVEVGIPDFASVESIYGRDDAHTIINSCGSKLVLNLGDPEAAKFFSELASEEEYWESGTYYSISENDRGGENHHRQVRVRKVIMPAEIMRLSVGQGYFMLPGGNPAPVTIPWTEANRRRVQHEPFLLRSGLSLDELEAKDSEISASAQKVIEGPVPEELKTKVTENALKGMRPMISDEEEEKREAREKEEEMKAEKAKGNAAGAKPGDRQAAPSALQSEFSFEEEKQ